MLKARPVVASADNRIKQTGRSDVCHSFLSSVILVGLVATIVFLRSVWLFNIASANWIARGVRLYGVGATGSGISGLSAGLHSAVMVTWLILSAKKASAMPARISHNPLTGRTSKIRADSGFCGLSGRAPLTESQSLASTKQAPKVLDLCEKDA